MSDKRIPEPDMAKKKKRRMNFSAVWLVPLLALVIAAVIVGRQFAERGPVIDIAFDSASGIVADSTVVKYRDVNVGKVEGLDFSEDLSQIIAHVRIDQTVDEFIDDDAKFWLVQPEVTTRGVSGLNTILSGVYIGASWDSEIGEPVREFSALDSPPLGAGEDGLYFTLRASNGAGVSDNTPIVYRGLEVGQISNPRLAEDGISVIADAFIGAPIDRQITTATRFWDTSGFNFSLGAGGAQLSVDSLATLLSGGVAFDSVGQTGRRVADGTVFELYTSEDLARNSIFGDEASGLPVDIGIVFDADMNGLTSGAAVEFRGIRIGEVSRLAARSVTAPNGDIKIQTLAYVKLSPSKMGLDPLATNEEVYDFLDQLAQSGVRAQLARGGILSGGLKIVFAASPAEQAQNAGLLNRDAEPYPIFPSAEADLPDSAATAEGVFQRINDLPVEELLSSAINLLDSVNLVVNSPAVREVPDEVVGLLQDMRNVTNSDAVQSLPEDISTLVGSLTTSVRAIESTLVEIEQEALVESLVGALDAFANSAKNFDQSIAGLPGIVENIQQVTENAAEIPLEDLVTQTTELLDSAEVLIASEDTQEIPAALNEALGELSVTLAQLRDGGLIENANATLQSASNAADAIATATETLPSLINDIDSLVQTAETTIAGYDPNSQMGRELITAMRDLSRAARSIDALVKQLERNPNSLLFGR